MSDLGTDRVPASLAQSPSGLVEIEPELRQRLAARAEMWLDLLPAELRTPDGPMRLTILVLTQNRPEDLARLLASLVEQLRLPARLLVIDDASQPTARAAVEEHLRALRAKPGALTSIDAIWHTESIGCSRCRQFAVGIIDTEYVLFLDDDTEVLPGAIEHLVHALERDPALLAVGGHLILPDGTTQLCGGEFLEAPPGVLVALPRCMGLAFDDPEIGQSGPSEWLAGAGVVFRREALLRYPLDPQLDYYYEDTEWCYRVGRERPPGAFGRVVESLVLHYQQIKGPKRRSPEEILQAVPYLTCLAHFYRRHGLVFDGVFHFVPRLLVDGKRDIAGARLLLELLAECGPEWVIRKWLAGLLEAVFARGETLTELERVRTELAAALEFQTTLVSELALSDAARRAAEDEPRSPVDRAEARLTRLLSVPRDDVKP
jgi:GT2 family glycosyltransferase